MCICIRLHEWKFSVSIHVLTANWKKYIYRLGNLHKSEGVLLPGSCLKSFLIHTLDFKYCNTLCETFNSLNTTFLYHYLCTLFTWYYHSVSPYSNFTIATLAYSLYIQHTVYTALIYVWPSWQRDPSSVALLEVSPFYTVEGFYADFFFNWITSLWFKGVLYFIVCEALWGKFFDLWLWATWRKKSS